MIEFIKGELAELTPAMAVIEAYGVGYALNISLNTYTAIQGSKEAKLFVHESLVTGGRAISTGNERLLKGVKGIGLKTAQRIIVDLKDKIMTAGVAQEIPAGSSAASTVNADIRDEAVSALTMLGFAPAPSAKVVTAIMEEQPDLHVEQVVKLALKQIK